MSTDKVLRFREAGRVARAHVHPYHGSYTVGEHCYNMMAMLHVFYPDASSALRDAILLHDVTERFTGDIPGHMPRTFPPLKVALRAVEAELRTRTDLHMPELTEEEQNWLFSLDVIELALWCLDQKELGNKHVGNIYYDVLSYLRSNSGRIPKPLYEFFDNFKWYRSDEFGENRDEVLSGEGPV